MNHHAYLIALGFTPDEDGDLTDSRTDGWFLTHNPCYTGTCCIVWSLRPYRSYHYHVT